MVDEGERFRIELFPFSYFDELRGRWMRARYVATLDDIRARYARYRLEGAPELRERADPSALTASHLAHGPGEVKEEGSR